MSDARRDLAGGNGVSSDKPGNQASPDIPGEVEFAVILVDSTSHALRIEKLLNQRGLANKLIPTPRQLSSDCGVCVRVRVADVEMIRSLLDDQHVVFQSIEAI